MADEQQDSLFRQESLERLSTPDQLDQLMQVVSAKSWLPLASLGSLIALALLWGIFGRIPVTAIGKGVLVYPDDSSQELVGLLYFQPGEGEQIQPGMDIIIVPDLANSERVGGIFGQVTAVSTPPLMTLEMARQAGATTLQQDAIEVLAELERDPSNPSGYRWSSLGGAGTSLSPGITTTARIIVEQKAPITVVFPFLKRSY